LTSNAPEDAEFSNLLDYVRSHRGFDFTGYKRSSLMRRVRRPMQTVEVESFGDYIDYLEVHPNEFQQLFNTLLINVTSIFSRYRRLGHHSPGYSARHSGMQS
jgi:two-component system CheB/CheR fusion protein